MNRVNDYAGSRGDETPGKVSVAVVNAVAEAVGADPTELQARLYDSIDPDALDALFRDKYDGTPRSGGHVTFQLYGYEVTVHSDGGLSIIDLYESSDEQSPMLTSWADRTSSEPSSTHTPGQGN